MELCQCPNRIVIVWSRKKSHHRNQQHRYDISRTTSNSTDCLDNIKLPTSICLNTSLIPIYTSYYIIPFAKSEFQNKSFIQQPPNKIIKSKGKCRENLYERFQDGHKTEFLYKINFNFTLKQNLS